MRFVYEVFRRLRPGVTVLSLHSKMKYVKRLTMYESFVRKQHAVLFATDIAARGLGKYVFHDVTVTSIKYLIKCESFRTKAVCCFIY